jgi:hypothetical protein
MVIMVDFYAGLSIVEKYFHEKQHFRPIIQQNATFLGNESKYTII